MAAAVTQLAGIAFVKSLGFSPLVVGIVCGMLYGNFLRGSMPAQWSVGVQFTAKRMLRVAVAFYGLNISIQQIIEVGLPGLVVSVGIVVGVLVLGTLIGTKLLKLDRDTAMLTSAGSAVCGAAAVLAFESTLKSAPHKASVAVATVVLFGTISLLVPVLIILGIWLQRVAIAHAEAGAPRPKLPIPWFAIGFLVLALINSANIIPPAVLQALRALDIFVLTMAMTALGIQTRFTQIRDAGPRVVALGVILFILLAFGGYALVKLVT
jgi:uncharacterized membrane protein YadS